MNDRSHWSIRGIVVPDCWDEAGNVLSVAIFTDREEKFRVVDDRQGKSLMDHLRKQVCVEGQIIDPEQRTSIRIDSYRLED